MNEPSAISAELSGRKHPLPKVWLVISALLWVAAWEAIVWLVPVQPRLILRGSDDLDFLMGFSPDGKTLVTVAGDRDPALPGRIYHLWDVETGDDLGVVGSEDKTYLPNLVYCSQKNLGMETIFPWNWANTYTFYDLTTRQETNSIQFTQNPNVHTTFCFSQNGRTLAWCNHQKDELDSRRDKSELWIIDMTTGQVRARLTGTVFGYLFGYVDRWLALSDDGGTLAVRETIPNGDDNDPDEEKVIVVDAATGKILWTFQCVEEILHLAFSPDGTRLAIYSSVGNPKLENTEDTQVRVCDTSTGKLMALFKGKGQPEFLPDNKRIALIDYDHISFRDALTGKEYAATNFTRYFDVFLRCAAVIPGSDLIAIPTTHDSKPNLFFQWCTTYLGIKAPGKEESTPEMTFLDSRTGSKIAGIVRKNMADARISTDGRTLALGTRENHESTIEIWDIPPGKPLRWVLGLLAIPSIVTAVSLWKWWRAGLRIRASESGA